MELDFHKDKQKIGALSDAELIARQRDPNATATDRMLVESEIARRGLDQRRPAAQSPLSPEPKRGGINFLSILIILVIAGSVIAGILEDLGIDVLEWLREFFEGQASFLFRG